MKIRPVEAELFYAGGRTGGLADGRAERHDGTKSRFSQFYERADKFLYSIKLSSLPHLKRKATQNTHTVQHELYSSLITCTKGFISEELQ